MNLLLRPLRPRRVWLTSVVVLVVAGFLLVVSAPRTPVGVVSAILLTLLFATITGSTVLLFTDFFPDYRIEALRGLHRETLVRVRRAVNRGNLDALTAEEQLLAKDYAEASVASTPPQLVVALLVSIGITAQAASRLLHWDGGWVSYLSLVEVVLFPAFGLFGLRRQYGWLINAAKIAQRTAGPR